MRQLFAQCLVKRSDSEAWERRRVFLGGEVIGTGGIGTGGGTALSGN